MTETRETLQQTIVPLRASKQPQPAISKGGDCGLCVLAGLLGTSVEDAYRQFSPEQKPLSYHGMLEALHKARQSNLIDRLIHRVPCWPGRTDAVRMWGDPAWCSNLPWFDYIRMALDAGYYGIAQVSHDREGPMHDGDHWVLICGCREMLRRVSEKCSAIDQEILVSCSSTKTPDEEWVEVREMLQKRGGYNCLLARPASA